MPQVQLSVLLQLKDMLSGGLGKVRGALSGLEQRLSAGQKQADAFNQKWGATMRLGQQVGAGMTAAGGLIVGSLVASAKAAGDYGGEIFDASRKTGMAADSLTALKFAGEQSGVAFGDLSSSIARMSRSAFEAAQGSKMQSEAFARIGVSATDANGKVKDSHTLFVEVGEALRQLPDQATRTASAMEIFGRSGANLLPLMMEGAGGITALEDKARSLGLVMSQDTAARLDEASDKFEASMQSIKMAGMNIGATVLPALAQIVSKVAEITGKYSEWAQAHPALSSALGTVALAVGGLATVIGPLLIVLPSLVSGWQFLTAAMGANGTLGAISALKGVLPALLTKLGTLASTALPAAASAVSGLGSSFAGMAAAGGPIALVILAIAALAYELYKLAQKWLEAKRAAEDSVKAFQRARDAETQAANARGAGDVRARQLKEIKGAKATVGERIWGALTPGKTSKQMAQERVAAGQSSSLFEAMRGAGRRAGGGPVAAGRPYIVGERGPELMVPQTAGNVVPSSRGLGRSQMPQIAQGGTTRQLIELRLAPGIIAREVSQAVQSPGVRQKIVSISQMTNAAAIPSTAY